jgi:tetratricopeptide (TPR) repeat protein
MAAAALVAPAEQRGREVAGDDAQVLAEVPRQASARLQLERAAAQRARLRKVERAELAEARRRAARSYVAVRLYFPSERELAAEASFRAAELWRLAGDVERAAAELEHALAGGAGTEFRARAALELGHLERRRRRWSSALDRYFAAAADAESRSHWRDEAALWIGKTYVAMGELEEARRHLARAAGASADPLARARAYDEWALTYVAGDLEAAAGVLARCRDALADSANEETELGVRLRRALASLRCITAIEREVARRRGTPSFHFPGGGEEDGEDD